MMKNINMFTGCQIFINDICNLRCKYCFHHYEKNDENKNEYPSVMGDETIDGISNFLLHSNQFRPSKGCKRPVCIFIGGEPTLTPDVMIKFISILKNKFNYYIMTNATIPLDKFINNQIIRENIENINFVVSFDGLNQKHRSQDNLDTILCNIELLKNNKIGFGLISVVSPDNIDNIEDNMIFLSQFKTPMKFKRVCALAKVWSEADVKKYISKLDRILLLNAYLENKNDIRIRQFNRINWRREDVEYQFCHQRISSVCTIGTDGKLYPCETRWGYRVGAYGDYWEIDKNPALKKDFAKYENYSYCDFTNSYCKELDEAINVRRDKYLSLGEKFYSLKVGQNKN